MSGVVGRVSWMYDNGWEALRDLREWSGSGPGGVGSLKGSEGIRSSREAHTEVQEVSGGPPRGPGGVGSPTRGPKGVGKPSRGSWRGCETLQELHEGSGGLLGAPGVVWSNR